MTTHEPPRSVSTTRMTVVFLVLAFAVFPYVGMFRAMSVSNDARQEARRDATEARTQVIEARAQVAELQRKATCRADIQGRAVAAEIRYLVALSQGGDVTAALTEVQQIAAAAADSGAECGD